jgi:hypothetical protein
MDDPVIWRVEPMPRWPYPETARRKSNPFRSKFDATLELLETELEHLRVAGAVALRVVARDVDVRRDGMLRAHAEVRHPGVALSFTSSTAGALTYPCDQFFAAYHGEVDWQINLRAIALGLEALRKLDRYGIAGHAEQYAGWRQIEAPSRPGFTSADEALIFLANLVDTPEAAWLDSATLVREARKKAHPDVTGSSDVWSRVDQAAQLLLPKVEQEYREG